MGQRTDVLEAVGAGARTSAEVAERTGIPLKSASAWLSVLAAGKVLRRLGATKPSGVGGRPLIRYVLSPQGSDRSGCRMCGEAHALDNDGMRECARLRTAVSKVRTAWTSEPPASETEAAAVEEALRGVLLDEIGEDAAKDTRKDALDGLLEAAGLPPFALDPDAKCRHCDLRVPVRADGMHVKHGHAMRCFRRTPIPPPDPDEPPPPTTPPADEPAVPVWARPDFKPEPRPDRADVEALLGLDGGKGVVGFKPEPTPRPAAPAAERPYGMYARGGRTAECAELLKAGVSMREVAERTKTAKGTVYKLAAAMMGAGVDLRCPCGKPLVHRGGCMQRQPMAAGVVQGQREAVLDAVGAGAPLMSEPAEAEVREMAALRKEPEVIKAASSAQSMALEVAGGLRFNISFNVTAAEMGEWPAERIASFFDGIRRMVEARSGMSVEKPPAVRRAESVERLRLRKMREGQVIFTGTEVGEFVVNLLKTTDHALHEDTIAKAVTALEHLGWGGLLADMAIRNETGVVLDGGGDLHFKQRPGLTAIKGLKGPK